MEEHGCDGWTWLGNSEKVFTVKNAYEELLACILTLDSYVTSLLWSGTVPSKVNVLA